MCVYLCVGVLVMGMCLFVDCCVSVMGGVYLLFVC